MDQTATLPSVAATARRDGWKGAHWSAPRAGGWFPSAAFREAGCSTRATLATEPWTRCTTTSPASLEDATYTCGRGGGAQRARGRRGIVDGWRRASSEAKGRHEQSGDTRRVGWAAWGEGSSAAAARGAARGAGNICGKCDDRRRVEAGSSCRSGDETSGWRSSWRWVAHAVGSPFSISRHARSWLSTSRGHHICAEAGITAGVGVRTSLGLHATPRTAERCPRSVSAWLRFCRSKMRTTASEPAAAR